METAGTVPPGNAPGEKKWTSRARASARPDLKLTSGKGLGDLTVSMETLVDMVVKENHVVAFIKGTRTEPQCGFSHKMLTCLNGVKANYEVVNVLDEVGILFFCHTYIYVYIYIYGRLLSLGLLSVHEGCPHFNGRECSPDATRIVSMIRDVIWAFDKRELDTTGPVARNSITPPSTWYPLMRAKFLPHSMFMSNEHENQINRAYIRDSIIIITSTSSVHTYIYIYIYISVSIYIYTYTIHLHLSF